LLWIYYPPRTGEKKTERYYLPNSTTFLKYGNKTLKAVNVRWQGQPRFAPIGNISVSGGVMADMYTLSSETDATTDNQCREPSIPVCWAYIFSADDRHAFL
jgi:hypothetical protein